MAEMPEMKRIFIIGPMSDDTGLPLANIRHIKAALETIFQGRGDIQIDIPQEQYTPHIPMTVFSAIDFSDLVIADISHRSPNVMYELALADALGIPTMLIEMPDAAADPRLPRKSIFYLAQNRTYRPASIAQQELVAQLRPLMDDWLAKPERYFGGDPLSQFFHGIPLVDVSAVAGIALGYAENFIAPLVTAIQGPAGQGPVKQTHAGKDVPDPRAIVVVLPKDLDNLVQEEKWLEGELEKSFGERGTLCKVLTAETLRGKRTVPCYIEGIFIDIPRTLIPLRRSPRIQRMQKAKDANWKIMEKRLIAAFKRSLQDEVQSRNDIAEELVHVVPRRELVGKITELLAQRK
jgi:nucleotide-binding STING sensor domain-containing protein